MTQPKCYHLSATCISAFKACPQRFRLGYREGLRVDEDTEALRVGTNWHAIHEVYRNALDEYERDYAYETPEAFALTKVTECLNDLYEDKPASKELIDWQRERTVLLVSFVGYLWYYQEDEIDYLSQELKFDLPLINPAVGLPLPLDEVKRVGKIDHLVRWQGMVGILERKSTSKSVDLSSDFWGRSKKDTQVSTYALAIDDLDTPEFREGLGIGEDERFGGTLYDAWHKPTTKPKALSQKDTAEFVETGEYHGQKFDVEVTRTEAHVVTREGESVDIPAGINYICIDGEHAEFSPGKKAGTFAVTETIEMYGARLLADIQERPEFYFQRKEITRTQQDLERFRKELFNIYQAQKMYSKTDCWFENEAQCQATFRCQYMPICYGPGADAVCDGKTTPEGFRRIFVDLTNEGQTVEETD